MSNEPSALRTENAIQQFATRSLDCGSESEDCRPSADAASEPGYGRVAGDGVYWNIQGTELPAGSPEPLGAQEWCEVQKLAAEPTRLKKLDECKIRWLVNWGFVAAERALPHLDRFRLFAADARQLPYPEDAFGPGSATSELCSGPPIECD